MKFYITFGQIHVHSVGGTTFDKDCVAEIEAVDVNKAWEKIEEAFGMKWSRMHERIPDMSFYPRGILPLQK